MKTVLEYWKRIDSKKGEKLPAANCGALDDLGQSVGQLYRGKRFQRIGISDYQHSGDVITDLRYADKDAARKFFQAVIEKWPESPAVAEAKKGLEQLK